MRARAAKAPEFTFESKRFWVERDRARSWWQRIWSKERRDARVYAVGGGWGDAINWVSVERLRVVGWKPRKPAVGDWLLAHMQSGSIGVFLFVRVEPCAAPRDMFFATVQKVGYAREITEGNP